MSLSNVYDYPPLQWQPMHLYCPGCGPSDFPVPHTHPGPDSTYPSVPVYVQQSSALWPWPGSVVREKRTTEPRRFKKHRKGRRW